MLQLEVFASFLEALSERLGVGLVAHSNRETRGHLGVNAQNLDYRVSTD